MTVWLAVTADKYELPVYMADTAVELARMVGVTAGCVYSCAFRKKDSLPSGYARMKGRGLSYRKVKI